MIQDIKIENNKKRKNLKCNESKNNLKNYTSNKYNIK